MMLGYLLARAGVNVLVLEKHSDFLRDFRGDTIHPSTLEVMHELGLLDEFLKLPHQKVYELNAQVGEMRLTIADFRHLPTRCGFVAFMPQWDFLNFVAEKAARYPNFNLMMEAEVSGVIEESGRVIGVRANTPKRRGEVRADSSSARTAGARSCAKGRFAVKETARDGRSLVSAPSHCGRSVATMGSSIAGRFFMLNRGTIGSAATSLPRGIRRDAPARIRNFSRGDREARALRERQRA